jgi:hypothetical protein
MRIEILVEEESIRAFLEKLIEKLAEGTDWILEQNVFIRSFEGKSHLRKELPNKAKVYARFHEPIFLLVLQDKDSNDCLQLKQSIIELVKPSGLTSFKVRIVCKELECWYLGDLDAVECVIPASKAGKLKNKSKYKDPEKLNGKDEIKKWIQPYSAIQFAKSIACKMSLENNSSQSFHQTVNVLKEILK